MTNFVVETFMKLFNPRADVKFYVIASYLGSNRIFNSKWSYDKILID